MPGPAPNPARRRRNAVLPMTQLPPAGHRPRAQPPAWPLQPDIELAVEMEQVANELALAADAEMEARDTKGERRARRDRRSAEMRLEVLQRQAARLEELERAIWADAWRTPMAQQWALQRWTREVAQYVRWKARAELGSLQASREATKLADRLGLTPLAMLRLRWEITPDRPASSTRPVSRIDDYRDAL